MNLEDIVRDLKANGGTLIEVLEYHPRSQEHSFMAYWLSDSRAFCGVCGACKSRKCGHDDKGLMAQVFLCRLSEWAARRENVRVIPR